jgi:spermidine synthase
MICGAITVAFLAGWLRFSGRERYGSFGLAALAALILTLSVVAGDALEAKLIERRWQSIAPGYELCAQAESRYQNLAIGRRVEQFTLYSDGQVTSDFPDPYTFVPLAHFFLCQHPSPRKVLVLGGGAEGLLAEILEHGVEHVDYVEPDPRQIALIEPFLTERDLQALTDARVTVHHVDGRYFIKTQADHAEYDLVLARLPEPMSALRARYYTKEFYGELRRTMTARSVLCTTAAATPGQLSAASAEYLASIRATLQPSFPHVTVGWGNPAHILAATEDGLISTDPATLVQRYAEHGARSEWFDPAWFDGAVDWLDPSKLQQRAAQLDAVADAQISTDLHPSLYVRRLDLWERMTSGTPHGAMTRLRSTGWVDVVVALAAISGLTLLACYLRARRQRVSPLTQVQSRAPWFSNGAIVLSIASTGLATMALSIVWLFAFQNLYGYVYQRIGWIIALFMAGLVLGCGLTDRRLKRLTNGESSIPHLWQGLIVVDALMAFLAITVPFLLPALGALQTSPVALTFVEWCVSFMVAVTGAFGGAAFAVAARLHLALTGRAGATAGSIVGADHAGACLGALLSGILLVPVFGIAATAWLLAGVKFSSVSLLAVARRLSREG